VFSIQLGRWAPWETLGLVIAAAYLQRAMISVKECF